jgi:sporadic carbohydrate cluster protein (TIGR04323 family)
MLGPTERHWDNDTLTYDTSRFDWKGWALRVMQEVEPEVTDLETLHERLPPTRLVKAQQHVQNACSRRDFMGMIDQFMAEHVQSRIEGKRYLIQRQGTLRCVIPNQTKVGRRLQFHQGIWVGNGRGMRTVWTPYTRCWGTNTMQILPLEISKAITKRCIDHCWDLETFEAECLKHSFPVELDYGKCHLFLQEHIHGNVNNDTSITRVSMDLRILIEGESYHRKLPGGYFRLPGDHEAAASQSHAGRSFITYSGWNSAFTAQIPLPMQRAVMDQYCQRNGISYSDYKFENEYLDWCPILRSHIQEKPDGIVLTSIFALPDHKPWRDEIMQQALDAGVELHFANELCSLKTREDLLKIQTYLEIAHP